MSLIAYLMEKKQNFGPHLIIVPNAGERQCCTAVLLPLNGRVLSLIMRTSPATVYVHSVRRQRTAGQGWLGSAGSGASLLPTCPRAPTPASPPQ